MAISLIQAASQTQVTSGTTAQRVLVDVAAGSLLTVTLGMREALTVSSIDDDVNGSWNLSNGIANGGAIGAAIYGFPNSASGTITITVTMSGTITVGVIMDSQEWAGGATSSVLGETNTADDTGSPYDHGSITTTSAGVIITSCVQSANVPTETPHASFVKFTDAGFRYIAQYWIAPTNTTTNGEWTSGTTVNTAGAIALFKEASGTARVLTKRSLLMGAT